MKRGTILIEWLAGLTGAAIMSAAWSVGLLLWSTWTTIDLAIRQYSSVRVSSSIASSDLWATPFRNQAIAFVAALVALHIALGLLIWGVTRLAVIALPQWRARAGVIALAVGGLLVGWILVANATWYPWSRWVGEARLIDFAIMLDFRSYHLFTALMIVSSVTLTIVALRRSGRHRAAWTRLLVYSGTAVVAMWLWSVRDLVADVPGHGIDRPHVIVIGIDSLRPDVVGLGQRIALTPHLDRFASESVVFTDAITPLARTFPAWVSILTGSHPATTGARENLLNPDSLSLPVTLPEVLRRHGYRTYYGTDEVRFSNIDSRYGFDEIIGPRMGASDFLLAPISDVPLLNLVANTVVGRTLFPNVHANRAAAVTYRSETFVDELARRVEFDEPTFMAVHLALPHWPYHWADSDDGTFEEASSMRYAYAAAVVEADRQFGQLLGVLERKGALQNAIVVVLSDHGEALGLPGDNLIYSREAKAAASGVVVNMLGHGNSVLSPSQYAVFLAFRGCGGQAPAMTAVGETDVPVSLEDIAPTVLALLELDDGSTRDGFDLTGVLAGDASAALELAQRSRFTETGITVGFTRDGQLDIDRLVAEKAQYYRVDPATARIELDPRYAVALMRAKERAVIRGNRILAVLPAENATSHRFIAIDRAGGVPLLFDSAADLTVDPELVSMWEHLDRRYDQELTARR